MESKAASKAMQRPRKLKGYGSKCKMPKHWNELTRIQPANQAICPKMKSGHPAIFEIPSLKQATPDRCRRNSCSSSAIESMFRLSASEIRGSIAQHQGRVHRRSRDLSVSSFSTVSMRGLAQFFVNCQFPQFRAMEVECRDGKRIGRDGRPAGASRRTKRRRLLSATATLKLVSTRSCQCRGITRLQSTHGREPVQSAEGKPLATVHDPRPALVGPAGGVGLRVVARSSGIRANHPASKPVESHSAFR